MNKLLILATTALGGLALAPAAHAQTALRAEFPYSHRLTVGAGLSQLLLGGGNVQVEYTTNRLVFDYSHGFNINLDGTAASSDAQDQKLAERLTQTLGVGVGYRLTPSLDIRLEPKLHFIEAHYNGAAREGANQVASYKTVTLGAGAYYKYYPFRKREGALGGLLLMPSVRYWPNVWSSLTDDKLTYANRATGKTETYRAASQGLPGTGGLLANVTLAYTFGMGRK